MRKGQYIRWYYRLLWNESLCEHVSNSERLKE